MKTITYIAKIIAAGVRADSRVRYGLGAGASVLLSAGVLGMGGSLVPSFLHASTTPPQTYSHAAQAHVGIEVVDMSTSTVAEIIHTLPKAERFELMLYNSGLEDVVHQAGTITVFVPASAEFDYLPHGFIAGLSRRETRTLALSHIVEQDLPMEESLSGNVVTAGQTVVDFDVTAVDEATVGDAKVLKAYKAKNGWVYLINKVLVDAGN